MLPLARCGAGEGCALGAGSSSRRSSDGTVNSDVRLVDGSYDEPAEGPLRDLSCIMPDAELPAGVGEETAGRWVERTDLYAVEERTTEVFLDDLPAALGELLEG
ncbi:hypothetical protein [Nesterenkonia sp. F]|uniref:hypothetical protein n=1 Tax=Nesterenkonia sp. F TaxID=795955 RepID=UPI0002F8A5C7|nr:hypothetical protein [Nesterenkonia sp. F]